MLMPSWPQGYKEVIKIAPDVRDGLYFVGGADAERMFFMADH
jgi:hypothetical protein